MGMITVIGLTGRARVGKDTTARFITSVRGGYQYSFADPLRSMLKAGFGIDMNDPYWQDRKEQIIPAIGKSPREMMQTLGTEWGRNMVSEDVWLTLAKQKLLSSGPGMVIADVRFDNEAEWVRAVGGRIIHVQRDQAERVKQHASEVGVAQLPGDGLILNNGTLEDLQDAVKDYFRL